MAILNARPATGIPEDFALRAADEAECRAGGMSGRRAATLSLRASTQSWEIRGPQGELLALWGWRADGMQGTAKLWMLSCPGIEAYPLAVARESRRCVAWLLETYTELEVLVHTLYEKSALWLQWLDFYPVRVVRVNEELFWLMSRRRA